MTNTRVSSAQNNKTEMKVRDREARCVPSAVPGTPRPASSSRLSNDNDDQIKNKDRPSKQSNRNSNKENTTERQGVSGAKNSATNKVQQKNKRNVEERQGS